MAETYIPFCNNYKTLSHQRKLFSRFSLRKKKHSLFKNENRIKISFLMGSILLKVYETSFVLYETNSKSRKKNFTKNDSIISDVIKTTNKMELKIHSSHFTQVYIPDLHGNIIFLGIHQRDLQRANLCAMGNDTLNIRNEIVKPLTK